MLTVATVNVNGIRAAFRRGMGPWLRDRDPGLGAAATGCTVDRAPTHAERWSDHAPVVATYSL